MIGIAKAGASRYSGRHEEPQRFDETLCWPGRAAGLGYSSGAVSGRASDQHPDAAGGRFSRPAAGGGGAQPGRRGAAAGAGDGHPTVDEAPSPIKIGATGAFGATKSRRDCRRERRICPAGTVWPQARSADFNRRKVGWARSCADRVADRRLSLAVGCDWLGGVFSAGAAGSGTGVGAGAARPAGGGAGRAGGGAARSYRLAAPGAAGAGAALAAGGLVCGNDHTAAGVRLPPLLAGR